MTRLREMMLEELHRRNYSQISTRNYLRVVADFAKYLGKCPDKLSPNELRTYQRVNNRSRSLSVGNRLIRHISDNHKPCRAWLPSLPAE